MIIWACEDDSYVVQPLLSIIQIIHKFYEFYFLYIWNMFQPNVMVSESFTKPCSPCTISRYPLGMERTRRWHGQWFWGKPQRLMRLKLKKNVPLGKLYSKQYLVFTFRFPSIIQYNINLSEYTWNWLHNIEQTSLFPISFFTVTFCTCLIHSLVFKFIWALPLKQMMGCLEDYFLKIRPYPSPSHLPVSVRGSSSSESKVQHWPEIGMDACVQRAEVGCEIGPS